MKGRKVESEEGIAATPEGPEHRPAAEPSRARPRRGRWIYFGLGWLFFGLGLLGAFLPILPTTPLMLLALWAFSRSSDRFYHWLYRHPVFGPSLRRWQAERTIPRWVKAVALGSMAASLGYVGLVVKPPVYALAAMAVVCVAGGIYLARIPSRRAAVPVAGGEAGQGSPEQPR